MGKKYILALVSLFVMVVNASSEDLQVDRIKYAEVLKHYSRQSSDSLKFRAALFLIDNIGLHFVLVLYRVNMGVNARIANVVLMEI